MFNTGNQTVDILGTINFSGNVIPASWFKTITKADGKAHLLAIVILADIVYWYRPQEVRDENTGMLIGYRKKFKSDLLQRSYDSIADFVGEGKQPVRRAVKLLENLGVIRVEFRTINANGKRCNNVMFIDLNADKLYDITYPKDYHVIKNDNTLSSKLITPCYQNCTHPVIKIDKTNTEITTEITTEISSSSPEQQEQLAESVYEEEEIKSQIDYKTLGKEYGHVVDLLVSAILDLSPEHRKKVTYEMADNICCTYKENKSRVRIPKKYIKTCLESIFDGGALTDRASPKKKANSFVDSCMKRNDIDFESLENELLNL